MNVHQIIVTGIASTDFSNAAANAQRTFKCDPKIVPICKGQYCSFTVIIDPKEYRCHERCRDFCNSIQGSANIHCVWMHVFLEPAGEKLLSREEIIYQSELEEANC